MVRFLNKNEYAKSIPLFISCFGDDEEFMAEYYGVKSDGSCDGAVINGDIAVLEKEDQIVSMVHVQYKTAHSEGKAFSVPYIMGVCTDKEHRHQGYMDQVMQFVLDDLKIKGYPWCFLIAVNKDIYRHLSFIYDWKLSEEECLLLYADDGLDSASACLLNVTSFSNKGLKLS